MNFEAVRAFFQPISNSQLDALERMANQARAPLAVGLDEVGMARLAQQVSADVCGVQEIPPSWTGLTQQD